MTILSWDSGKTSQPEVVGQGAREETATCREPWDLRKVPLRTQSRVQHKSEETVWGWRKSHLKWAETKHQGLTESQKQSLFSLAWVENLTMNRALDIACGRISSQLRGAVSHRPNAALLSPSKLQKQDPKWSSCFQVTWLHPRTKAQEDA